MHSYLTSSYYKFTDADDHTAYVRMYTVQATSTPGWGYSVESSHDNRISSAWTAFRSLPSYTLRVSSGAVTVTSRIATCLDIPARPDACSAYKTLSHNR